MLRKTTYADDEELLCLGPLVGQNRRDMRMTAAAMAREADATMDRWRRVAASMCVDAPDPRWGTALRAVAVGIASNVQQGGRLPVCPVNYGVYTRDTAYMVYTLLMSGQNSLARQSIEYLLANPWSGRPFPEGDTPGLLLWLLGKY